MIIIIIMTIDQINNNLIQCLGKLVHQKPHHKKRNNFHIDGKICLKCIISFLDRSQVIMKTIKSRQSNIFNLVYEDIWRKEMKNWYDPIQI